MAPRRGRIGRLIHIHRDSGAWSVRVRRKGQGFADYFPDGVWGGRERSLLAAQRFRDQLLLRIAPDIRVRRQVPRGIRSVTGVVGVSFDRRVVRGRAYEYYVATWQDRAEGSQRRRFSVARYGKARALAQAIEAREAGVARSQSRELARQREEARHRLQQAAPGPHQVKDPLSRKGISMARRRPRRPKASVAPSGRLADGRAGRGQ